MRLQPAMSSEDILRPHGITSSHYLKEERRRTGRYVAGGAALAIIMIGVYHIFTRSASTVAGICVPAIIMALYIVWVLYSIRRDRIRAVRLASAMHLLEVNDSSNISKITNSGIINFQKSPLDTARATRGQMSDGAARYSSGSVTSAARSRSIEPECAPHPGFPSVPARGVHRRGSPLCPRARSRDPNQVVLPPSRSRGQKISGAAKFEGSANNRPEHAVKEPRRDYLYPIEFP